MFFHVTRNVKHCSSTLRSERIRGYMYSFKNRDFPTVSYFSTFLFYSPILAISWSVIWNHVHEKHAHSNSIMFLSLRMCCVYVFQDGNHAKIHRLLNPCSNSTYFTVGKITSTPGCFRDTIYGFCSSHYLWGCFP
jgi:hypothetical protein